MRAYLPLTADDLIQPLPPTREPVWLDGTREGEEAASFADQVAEDALEEAAFQSLLLAQKLESFPLRVVGVGDLGEEQAHFSDWGQIDAFMVDGSRGQELAAAALAEDDEAAANELVTELCEELLIWYDGLERSALGAALNQS